jgi:hypothetical protein
MSVVTSSCGLISEPIWRGCGTPRETSVRVDDLRANMVIVNANDPELILFT